MEPRLAEAQAGKRAVLFVDASHFVYASFLGYLWSFSRLFIKSPSGRKRYNVLGALDAISKKVIMFTNNTYINSESVCSLMRKIKKAYPGMPITLILDNAPYQKAKIVREAAGTLKIELLFLPSYSPNLNLIERVWKFVKKECLYSKYYEQFDDFTKAIESCLKNLNRKHKKKISSLLSLKFQIIKQESIAA